MRTIIRCAVQSYSVRTIVLCVALLTSPVVNAGFAECDADMTEDQRFQAELCSAHIGCRFVFAIADSCIKAKQFLSKLGLGRKGSATSVTDSQVSNALSEVGVPRSGIASCLVDFDRTKCKEFFSGGPKQPSAKEQADDIAERLRGEVYSTTAFHGGLGLAKKGLQMCADATNEANTRDAVRAKERCALAENNIRVCVDTKQGHDELRQKLQGLIDSGRLGADAAGYRKLATTPYPDCPTTLPNSSKTPNTALADYLKFWDTPEAPKSKQAETADDLDLAALPSRGTNSASEAFKQSLNPGAQAGPGNVASNKGAAGSASASQQAADLLAVLRPALSEAAKHNPKAAKNLAALDALSSSSNGGDTNALLNMVANETASTNPQAAALMKAFTGNSSGSSGGTGASYQPDAADTDSGPTGGGGRPYAECLAEAKASPLPPKLAALPQNDANLLTRGAIAVMDSETKIYRQCLPDPRAQELIAAYKKTRADTLRVCRQISSSDNCEVSPF